MPDATPEPEPAKAPLIAPAAAATEWFQRWQVWVSGIVAVFLAGGGAMALLTGKADRADLKELSLRIGGMQASIDTALKLEERRTTELGSIRDSLASVVVAKKGELREDLIRELSLEMRERLTASLKEMKVEVVTELNNDTSRRTLARNGPRSSKSSGKVIPSK
jgi:hypothetical protein